ncbi:MAG TPA: MFS transporter [Candidatus Sulfotelmatobacter sp.]|nr:MFS transporter [Candidatus Sulfotelmatobacter sp.]
MTRWPRVTLLILTGVVAAFGVGKVPVALPLLRDELRLSGLAAGALVAAISGLGALAGTLFGVLADRIGHRRALAAGLVTIALAGAAGGFARGAAGLLAARVVEGIGFLAVIVAVPPLIVASSAPRDRRLALGLWSCYVPVGSAVVLFAAPALVALGGWRAVWFACAAVAALLAAACAALAAPRAPAPDRAPVGEEIRALGRARNALVLAIGFGGYTATYLALVGFLPTMLVAGGAALGTAATASALVVLANGAGNIAGGIAVRWLPRWSVMVVAAAVMGLGAALLYARGLPLPGRYAAAFVAALGGGTIPAAVMASVPLYAPAPRLLAGTQGLVVQGSSLGQVAGPLLVGALGVTRGGLAGSVLMLLCTAVCAAAGLVLRRAERVARAEG